MDFPLFFLDLRNQDLSTPARSWLAGPRFFRANGCCCDPGLAESY